MPDNKTCTLHPSLAAVGNCSRCKRSFCLDCLDMETGQILCVECKAGKTPSAASAAPPRPVPTPMPTPAASNPLPPGMGGSPLNFKNKGLDDDPLGLLGGGPMGGPPKLDVPKPNLAPPMMPKPSSAPPPMVPKPAPIPPPVAASAPKLDMSELGVRANTPPSVPSAPSRPEGPHLDDLMTAPMSGPPAISAPPVPGLGTPAPGPMQGLPVAPVDKNLQNLSLVKTWVKYLTRQAYHLFDPLAYKFRVSVPLLLGGTALVLALIIGGLIAWLNKPVIAIAKMVPTIHIIKITSDQISEMDVTAYSELQNQLQAMGFAPLIQMTVPQLPSPNYFDVGIKQDVGTYSEILKLPGQIAPHLSFVTVFTNGLWCSTNGWQGKNQELEYLSSEYDPDLHPDQLYVKHIQRVEKLKKDLQVQGMSESRYVAALTDHLRWFLVKKDIQGYQADFNTWH